MDQGRQLMSAEFQELARCYIFESFHTAPRFPQSKGFIKAMVKTMKQSMRKVEESGEDPHLFMMACRATPKGLGKLSPTEAIMQHKFRALLQIRQHLLCPS